MQTRRWSGVSILGLVWLLGATTLLSGDRAWAEPNEAPVSVDSIYRLGSADRIQISVFNQKDLSDDYSLDGSGSFSMPLIGTIKAAGLTVTELEKQIEDRLRPDYLLNPKVNIQVLNYRPYYILGEVKNPGSYPYVDGINVLNAIAIAGGFTEWADKDDLLIVREVKGTKTELRVDAADPVWPGDTIQVRE